MDFGHALLDLMFGTGKLDAYGGFKVVVFAVASASIAFLSIVLDFIIFLLRGRSVLNLSYGTPVTFFRLVLLWGLGAGIGGLIGSMADIVQTTRAACITMGVAWPAILPRLIAAAHDEDDDQPPEAK